MREHKTEQNSLHPLPEDNNRESDEIPWGRSLKVQVPGPKRPFQVASPPRLRWQGAPKTGPLKTTQYGSRQCFRDADSKPYRDLKVNTSTFDWTQKQTGNQCREMEHDGNDMVPTTHSSQHSGCSISSDGPGQSENTKTTSIPLGIKRTNQDRFFGQAGFKYGRENCFANHCSSSSGTTG